MPQDERKQVPIREGMLRLPSAPGEKPCLTGARCRDCGEAFFPGRAYCANCTSSNMEEIPLSDEGTVRTYTIVRQSLPGSAMVAPYPIVIVRLPEGIDVQTVMVDCDPEKVHIGMPVELTVRKVRQDEAGNDVMSFMFRPKSNSAAG